MLGKPVRLVQVAGEKSESSQEGNLSRNFDILQRAGKQDEVVTPSSDGLSPKANGHHPWDHRKPSDEEAIKLAQRVFVFPNSNAPRVVVFASVQGDGSSDICSRAGQALAAQGIGSVCLVDGNLSAPAHQLLEAEKIPGTIGAAPNPYPIRDSATRLGDGNFWVAPSGSPGSDGQCLLGAERMRLRMAELREQFDYVLIDAPPLDSSSDGVLLGQIADGIILVIEANSTRRENARMTKETLENAHVRILGAILNNRTFPIPEALYRRL